MFTIKEDKQEFYAKISNSVPWLSDAAFPMSMSALCGPMYKDDRMDTKEFWALWTLTLNDLIITTNTISPRQGHCRIYTKTYFMVCWYWCLYVSKEILQWEFFLMSRVVGGHFGQCDGNSRANFWQLHAQMAWQMQRFRVRVRIFTGLLKQHCG